MNRNLDSPAPTTSETLSTGGAEKIFGAGEMASLIRENDWASTSLGQIDTWSESLLCSVNMMLASRFPIIILWGPEFIQIYNDAYIPLIAEKHPHNLGSPSSETWGEAWHVIGPQLRAALNGGESTYRENVLVPITRDGHFEDVYWTYSTSPVYESSGEITGILSIVHDTTSEVHAKRERDALSAELNHVLDTTTESQRQPGSAPNNTSARLNAIYNTSLEYIGLLSTDGRLLDCNRASLEFASNTREDVVGLYFWETPWFIRTPGAAEMLRDAIKRSAGGEYIRYECSLARPSGEIVVFDFSLTPVHNSSGDVVFLVPEGRDITWMKKAETALKETEKLAAVGRLAASIAHEINNPLEAVTNLIYLAIKTENRDELKRYLHAAERELRRVSIISSQTLRFYRQSSNPNQVVCDELIDSVLSIHQGRIVNARIQVEKRLRAKESLRCLDGEIRQVLNNLVGNAIDAMQGHVGRLIVRTREGTHWRTRRKGIIITIADTGRGIHRGNLRKIFEPFFSTKGMGGTGLGLWVSQEIVQRHLGTLRVRSSEHQGHSGTVFTLFLPFDGAALESAA